MGLSTAYLRASSAQRVLYSCTRLGSAVNVGVLTSMLSAPASPLQPATAGRQFSSRSSDIQRARDKMDQKKACVMKPQAGDPYFREVWRKFQLKVHPDLFTAFPDLQAANSESLAKLQGILTEAKSGEKTTDDYMKPRNEVLQFYLRTAKENAFMHVPLAVKLPGGNCKNVLADCLCKLFKAAGLPTRFHWGEDYWNSTYTARPTVAEEDEIDEEMERRHRQRRSQDYA